MGNGQFTFFKNDDMEKRALDFTKEYARERAFDPRAIEIVEVKQSQSIFSHICLVPLFDLHSASVGSNAIREEKAVHFVKQTANAFCVLGGDAVNSVIKADQNAHDDKYGNQRAIAREIDLYSSIVDKIPLMLDGNHDGENGSRWSASNMSPTRHIIDGLRTYDPASHSWNGPQHCKFGVILKFQVPTCDHKREPRTFSIYLHHGSGRGGSSASSIESEYNKAIAYLNDCGEAVDAIITGHHHSNTSGVISQKVPVFDEQGKLVSIIKKDAVVISESTLQEVSNYALAAGYAPSDSNVYIYDFCLERNNYHTMSNGDVQPEYVLKCIRMPMFRKNSNEYTEEAENYMKAYEEPDIEAIKESIKDLPNKELYLKLKGHTRDCKSLNFIKKYKNMTEEECEKSTIDEAKEL